MSDKQQIEEMARKMCRNYQPNGSCVSDDDPCHLECVYGYCAERIYCAGYRKQEWISVDERLPTNEGKYLVCTAKGKVYVENFVDYYGNGKRLCFCNYIVTHWMPLPKPPKGE